MTTRRDFLKTMTMASAGLALGTGDLLGGSRFLYRKEKLAADKSEDRLCGYWKSR